MKETELAKKIIPWLEEDCWDIYPEFSASGYGGAIDILAVRGKITWSIEVKTVFNLNVVEQAVRNNTLYKSVFVPSARNRSGIIYQICRVWGVGVLEYVGNEWQYAYGVYEKIPAKLHRQNKKISDRYLEALSEAHKTYAEPGIKNGRRLTPYRVSMNRVEKLIKAGNGITIGEIFDVVGKLHYASKQSFRSSLPSALRSFEVDWCAEKDGKFYHRDKLVKEK